MCCYLLLYAKVVLLAFKPLLHNPFLCKERKINSIIAMIHGLDPRKHLFAMVGIDRYTSSLAYWGIHNTTVSATQ